MLKSYVISLTSSIKRREHIQYEFGKEQIPFEFFDAVTPFFIEEVAQKLNINIKHLDLTSGEKACLLSHLSLWQKALDEELDYIAIFEDDVYLGENIVSYFQDVSWIPKNESIIKLEYFERKVLMSFKNIFLPNQRRLRKLEERHLGAAGYILSAYSAKRMLDYVREQKNILAVDHVLFEEAIDKKLLSIYQMVPALCIQSDRRSTQNYLESDLETERRKRLNKQFIENKKYKLSFGQKVKREAFRIWMQFRRFVSTISFR